VRILYSHEKIGRIVEGESATLIENGNILTDRLKKEVLTRSELEIAAHKQGFASLGDVDRAVLEAGGVISFVGKQPAPDAARHSELTTRMDEISRKLDELRASLTARE
jgi:uncharacterized membrane protein YcaP (DUF421 family)